jgi:glycosyltransferase 2 family protein
VTVDLEEPGEVQSGAGTGVQPVSTSGVRRGWGSSVFGIVAEGRARRRPSDIALVVVALVLVAIASAEATEVTTIEAAAFDLIATLPGGLEPLWNVLYFLSPIVAAALLVTALVARRPRLLVTQAVAVGVAWLVGVALSAAVDVPDTVSDAGVALHGHTPDFPVVLLAASGAGLWASRPYLTRPARRMLEAVFWLSAIAAADLAEGLPGAVIASLVLAWGAAALAHLCFGSPAATPSADQVADSLRYLGVDPGGLRLAQEQTWGVTNYTAGSEAELSIEVVGRDSTDARLFAKLWRFVWYKDSGPTLSLTREHQVEHQAYVLFLAGRTGARLPDVVAAGLAGWRDDAIVVVRNPPGVSLSGVEPERVADAVLDDAWTNLMRLHDGRIAHGNPWVGNVVLDDAGTTGLIGLGEAVPSASDARLRLDRVQLVATTAQLVGKERALAAAHRGLSTDDLVELLAFLEPTALTGAAKRHLTDRRSS